MPTIARVVSEIGPDREFDYLVPEGLRDRLRPGDRVRIPFGRSETTGYIVALTGHSARHDLKPIRSAVGAKPLIGEALLKLAQWVGEYYGSSVAQAIRTVLPSPVRNEHARFKERKFVRLTESGRSLAETLGKGAAPPAKRLPAKQAAALARLAAGDGGFLGALTRELGVTAAPLLALQKQGLVAIERETQARLPLSRRQVLATAPLQLAPAQAAALSEIRAAVDGAAASSAGAPAAGGALLLHGVTGSGKTEVYLQAIDYVRARGRQAIVLVPEISLTPQTQERFLSRFGSRVAVLHSHLSAGERHDEWHRIREGGADIVIGARSAVFAPLGRLGLIVVDEEHEPSYKQEDAPRYNARDVALMRGRLEGCAVVLGSATPSMESWRNARTGKYRLAELLERVDGRRLPVVRIVDMRLERERAGHVTVLSAALVEAVRLRLERGEQTMLFLNRRGFATSLVCPRCGYVAQCDHCSVACTYHRSDDRLRCHICGASRPAPAQCPGCRDPAFRFAGVGTQRVEAVVARCFPQARLQRMDADMTAQKGSHDRILGDFRSGKTDILIGTQMIAKGLHFPNVTLVGVVYADLSLHLPDFRAGERTFQLLAQVAGRAGRGDVPGEVLVQTYTPFHPAIQAARRQDAPAFYDQEIEFRRELSYPPFTHLACVTLKGPSEQEVAYCAGLLARRLRPAVPAGVILADPSPAPLLKAKGRYRYQIMLRGRSPRGMMQPLRATLDALKLPARVSVAVDVDALSLL